MSQAAVQKSAEIVSHLMLRDTSQIKLLLKVRKTFYRKFLTRLFTLSSISYRECTFKYSKCHPFGFANLTVHRLIRLGQLCPTDMPYWANVTYRHEGSILERLTFILTTQSLVESY